MFLEKCETRVSLFGFALCGECMYIGAAARFGFCGCPICSVGLQRTTNNCRVSTRPDSVESKQTCNGIYSVLALLC